MRSYLVGLLAIVFVLLVGSSPTGDDLNASQSVALVFDDPADCDGGASSSGPGVRDSAYIDAAFDNRLARFISDVESVAGLAVSVVHGNKVIYTRSFGYRDLGACIPVTPDTRFYLKSTTKSFLGVLAAQLQHEGAIELDAPITDYLPDLSPPGVDASLLTVRQHLTHGIPYFDGGLNYKSAFVGMDSSEYVPHINTYARVTDTRFRYSNFGPIVAAHAIGRATNSDWRHLIKSKVFEPLGMASSFTSMKMAEDGPMAIAYRFGEDGSFVPTQTKADIQMHAAGGSVSTASDLARWLIASLHDGVVDGEQRLAARAFQQAHAPQIGLDRTFYKFHRFAHGLGHYRADYEGDLLVHHFGGETHVSFMPEHGIGVAVLSNQIDAGVFTTHRVAALIYDYLLKKDDMDARWLAAESEIRERIAGRQSRVADRVRRLREAAPDTTVTIERTALAGRYRYDRLGEIVLAVDDTQGSGGVLMQFGALSGTLEYVRGNAYLADFDPWGGPPELFVFRHDDETGQLILDWGGRLFHPVG